jgi:hypothetical protein
MGRLLLRVVTGSIPTGQRDAVAESLEREYVPVARTLPGLARYLIGTWSRPASADGDGIAFLTLWDDVEAASAAFGGRLTELRLIDGFAHGEVLEQINYYEVDIVEAGRRSEAPRYLRLTAGTLGRGLDADIQRNLRARLDNLPPEIVDAYVGRRVSGQSVEIAFVSTWTAAATTARLEQPVWPEISSQYDTFSIRVCDLLLEGTPPT